MFSPHSEQCDLTPNRFGRRLLLRRGKVIAAELLREPIHATERIKNLVPRTVSEKRVA
jgi:hypothetical protein